MVQYQISDSVGGNHLSQLKETQGNVISLHDDLSVGPLKEIRGFFKKVTRESFWNKVWGLQGEGSYYLDDENFDNIRNILSNGDTINVWVGPNTREELNFMKIVSEFSEYFAQIYYTQFKKLNSPNGPVYSLGECPPGVVRKLYLNKKQLTEEQAKSIKESWENVLSNEGMIRVRKDFGVYYAKSEDFFDKSILSVCSAIFIPVKKLALMFSQKYGNPLPIEFIYSRIGYLIENGFLIYRGDISSFSNLEVRLD